MNVKLVAGVIALAVLVCFSPGQMAVAAQDAELNPDGLYTHDWFLESFLELNEDLQEAAGKGKGFAIIWEQRGCPYCRETHLVNLAQPEILNFVKGNFEMLQLNTRGDREVTAFDGEKLSERALAAKYHVRYTPTVTFYARNGKKGGDGKREAVEVARIAGYHRPFHFLMAFEYVRDKAYLQQKFRPYIAMKTAQRKKLGKPVRFR